MAARLLTIVSAFAMAGLLGCQGETQAPDGASGVGVSDSAPTTGGDEASPPVAPENPLLAMTDTAKVTLNGETFTVALAMDHPTRVKGLGDVPDIPADRGMLFVFPRDAYLSFLMRDCLVDIDIAYLNSQGRVGKMYTMTMEPRREGEEDNAYDARLTKYPSRFPARMALELRAGTLERLGVSLGDTVEIEGLEALKERAE